MTSKGERVRLAGGEEVIVRPIEPEDRKRLADAFDRLGERTRYERFLAPKPSLSADELTYLTDVDHVDHEAVVALDRATGRGVGVARYIRFPDRPAVAEAAVVVVDEWQARGVGRLLLDRLVARAEANGIARFRATLLTTNRAVHHMLAGVGEITVMRHGEGAMELDVELPVERQSLRLALRGAARREAWLADRV